MPVPTLYNEPLAYNDNSLYNGPLVVDPPVVTETPSQRYGVVLTKNYGTRLFEMGVVAKADALTGLVIDEYSEELNGIASATLTIPTLHSKAPEFKARGETNEPREVEIWREGVRVFCGPIMATDANGPLMTIRCKGLEQYVADRLFGPTSTQQLTNGNFETGDTTGWTSTGLSQFTVVGGSGARGVQRGDNAALIETATAGGETYVEQVHDVANTDPAGATRDWHASLWYHWDAATLADANGVPQVSPAILERGLFVRVEYPIGTVWNPTGADPVGDHVVPITRRDLPNVRTRYPNVNRRMALRFEVPTGVTSRIRLRGYCPQGLPVYIDEGSMTREVEIGYQRTDPTSGIDLNVLVQRLFDHAMARDSNEPALTYSGSTIGTITRRSWLESSNAGIWEAMVEMANEGHFDVWCEPADRTFRCAPSRGASKPKLVLELGKNVMERSSWAVDGGQVVTRVRVTGQGEGADQEMSVATDTSQLGGLVVESVESLGSDVPLIGIDSKAQSTLALRKGGVHTPTLTILDSEVADNIAVGDRVPVRADYGAVQESLTRRVIKRVVKPRALVDDVSVTLQPAP